MNNRTFGGKFVNMRKRFGKQQGFPPKNDTERAF